VCGPTGEGGLGEPLGDDGFEEFSEARLERDGVVGLGVGVCLLARFGNDHTVCRFPFW